MVEGGAVCGADAACGHGLADEKGEDLVIVEVVFRLVKGDDDEGAVDVESRVAQERLEEVSGPGAADGDGRVVAVVVCWGRVSRFPLARPEKKKMQYGKRGTYTCLG